MRRVRFIFTVIRDSDGGQGEFRGDISGFTTRSGFMNPLDTGHQRSLFWARKNS